MATDAEQAPEDDERKPLSWKVIAAAALLLVLFGLILFGGMRGCAAEDAQEAAKRLEKEKKDEKEKEKKKEQQEDPKIFFPVVVPNEGPAGQQWMKPGHWASAAQQMQARERDFIGQTVTEVVDETNHSVAIEHTPFELQSRRPAALAKGTTKVVESLFFMPQNSEKLTLVTKFDEGGIGYARERPASLKAMLPHQYHFVVLAKEPERYSVVKTADSVQPPYNGEPGPGNDYMKSPDDPQEKQYYVELLDLSRHVPLPDNPLMWTTIAYVLWDEVDPEPFTPEQEKALVDWLHWGGQLIINGPDSLDLIKGSFLDPLMPATNGGPREIAASDLRTLSENWRVSTTRRTGLPIEPVTPWSGITLVPKPGVEKALFESTGGMLIERRVGRGRIVVSAMQLMERDLVNWRSGFDSLFNACLLRRPPREWRQIGLGTASLLWDTTSDPSLKDRRLDARLNTGLRYFARDLGVETNYRWVRQQDPSGGNTNPAWSRRVQANNFNGDAFPNYVPPPSGGGIGAWNDFNPTATAARNALREAAGVDVPNRNFVVACLGAYLFVLVPVNWLIFRMLGRIEWAWIAAPLIAIAGTYVVVQRAQLDIGFVRSQTEIGLLELQPDHPRGHLARFTALYTSLSTTYDLSFSDPTALAMPFPNEANSRFAYGPGRSTIDFSRQGEGVRMSGLPILSNSTNFVHSEQMLTLEGPVRLGRSSATNGSQIENHSQLRLQSVGIVRKNGDTMRGIWIGELAPGQSTSISDPNNFPILPPGNTSFDIERTAEARRVSGPRLNLDPLLLLAYDAKYLDDGETRLVARVEEQLAGETVSPEASQLRSGTLVVAHLDYAPLPLPRHDVNTRQDVKIINEEEL